MACAPNFSDTVVVINCLSVELSDKIGFVSAVRWREGKGDRFSFVYV